MIIVNLHVTDAENQMGRQTQTRTHTHSHTQGQTQIDRYRETDTSRQTDTHTRFSYLTHLSGSLMTLSVEMSIKETPEGVECDGPQI